MTSVAIDLHEYFGTAQRELQEGVSRADVTSRLEKRGVTSHEAVQVVAQAEDFNQNAARLQESQERPHVENRNDVGNAKRLVKRHGKGMRFVGESQTWLAWNGKAWAPKGARGAVERYAVDTAESIYDEAKAMRGADKEAADKLAGWASTSCSAARLEGMMKVARSKVEVAWDSLDADPWALNAQNGTVDLKTESSARTIPMRCTPRSRAQRLAMKPRLPGNPS